MYHYSWKKISREIVNKTTIIAPDEFTISGRINIITPNFQPFLCKLVKLDPNRFVVTFALRGFAIRSGCNYL